MWFENFLPFFVWDLLHCDTIGYLSFTFRNLPQAFCIFRIMGNPKWLGNLNVNVESFTSNILILDPCFSSCLVERFTFGNVGQSPTNEQWSIEKNLLLDYKCGRILFCQNPLFRFVGALFTTFKCCICFGTVTTAALCWRMTVLHRHQIDTLIVIIWWCLKERR